MSVDCRQSLSVRIAIIKTFALSKLNHIFFCLPSAGKEILKTIEGMFLGSSEMVNQRK